MELVGGIALPPGVQLSAGAILGLAGGAFSGLTVSSGHTVKILSGGTDLGATVSGGGTLIVGAGGTDSGATIRKGGVEIVSAGGAAIDAKVSSGGALVVSSGGVADPTTIFSGGTETIRAGGTDDGARISSGGKLFVQSGGTAIDVTIFSGGSAVNSAHGELDVVAGATDSGVLVNSGTINVRNGATLTLDAATLNNAGSINLLGSTSSTTLFIAHDVTLSGGGTVSMAGGHNLITDSGHSFTLTNVNDKIVGGGGLGGEFALFVVNKAGGIINGNGSGTVGELDIVATVTNAGLIEGTTSRGVAIGGSASLTTNSGTIAALGTGAFAQILETTVVNSTTKALILASGNGAQISLVDVTISGGTLKSSAGGQITGFDSSTLSGVTIAASSFLVDINDSILTLKGGTIGAGAIIETSGGTAIVSGTVTNGGTLFASATGDLIEIASGAVVNGGVALIGDGIVEFAGSSGESVRFLSNGSGGLKIADTVGHTSAFSGRVSGFGGSGHSKPEQFIDLVSVASAPNTISLSYVARRTAAERCSSPAAARWSLPSRWSAAIRRVTSISPPGPAALSRSPIRRFPMAAASSRVRPPPSRGRVSISRTSPSVRRRRLRIHRTRPAWAGR